MPYRLLAVVLLAAACASTPRLRLPQVEQATQATHRGGERYRAHQRCAGIARTVEDLVECMRQEGYEFIARAPDYPSRQCWEAREPESAVTDVPPHCFTHAPGTPH
jgi:hypothetical protein